MNMGKVRRRPAAPSTAPRIERKTVEKNRRIRMKTLYSNLISFLPDHTSKVEGLPLPDQIGEAVEYISSMKEKLENLRQKKELLLRGKRSNDSYATSSENQASTNKRSSPVIEVHDMGPKLDVVLADGIQDYSTFHHFIRLIHQHGVEIASASFARDGNSTLQVYRDKAGRPNSGFEGATLSRKLKELVCGTCSSSEVVDSELSFWDYELGSNIWGFDIPQVLAAGTNFGYYEQFLNI